MLVIKTAGSGTTGEYARFRFDIFTVHVELTGCVDSIPIRSSDPTRPEAAMAAAVSKYVKLALLSAALVKSFAASNT